MKLFSKKKLIDEIPETRKDALNYLLKKLRSESAKEMTQTYRDIVEKKYREELEKCISSITSKGAKEGVAYLFCIYNVFGNHLEEEQSVVKYLQANTIAEMQRGPKAVLRVRKDQKLLNSLVKEVVERYLRNR